MPNHLLRIGRRPRTIRFWLGLLALACAAPSLLGAGFLISDTYARDRANVEAANVATARALGQTVDRELVNTIAILNILAKSQNLKAGNLGAFYDRARDAISDQAFIANIVLSDPSGQQLVNTLRPFGASLPRHGNPDQLRRVIEGGKPVISDLYIGGVARRPLVGVEVPVRSGDRIIYSLAAGLFPEQLAGLLRQERLPAGIIATIFDSTGTSVARTEDPGRFVGQKGNAEFIRRIAEHPEGSAESTTLGGTRVISGWSRSSVSHWTVAIGTPASTLMASVYRSLAITAAAILAVLAAGALMARAISSRISRSLHDVVAPAMAIGSSASAAIPDGLIVEVNELGHALANAAQTIEQRVIERDEATRHEQEAAAANRAKSEFLALMSHELRTPMNGILGFAQLMSDPHFGSLSAKHKEFVEQIVTSGNHLLRLISDILDLSKIEAGRLSVSMERIALVPLVKSVAATLSGGADSAGIALDMGDFGVAMPDVLADRVRLAQILINLGSNAIKYNRRDGSVRFSYRRLEDQKVRLTVEDDGFGIPAERQSELFKPFSRLGREASGVDGTGVGLALSRRLIEFMGGAIGFESTPGRGSRFWVDIPVYIGATQAAPREPAPEPAHRRSGFTALYVDDNPASLALVRNILSTLDHVRLLEANDGKTALTMAHQHRPDLIILDINLPDMSGFALLQKLKQLPESAATPVMALSASAMPRDLQRGLEAGFFRYLTKPLDINHFLQSIDDALAAGRNPAAPETSVGARAT